MKRRTDSPMTSQQLFDNVLYTPQHWPWKTVALEHDSLLDYKQRSVSARVSVAELYHENSKLFPQMLSSLIASRIQAGEFRREFIRRRAAVVRPDESSILYLNLSCRQLLTEFCKAVEPELFYAIELRLVVGRLIAAHEPVSDTLQVIKQLSVTDLDVLERALRLTAAREAPPHKKLLLFIIGCFSRNDILFGVRGYRRTLLEAGQVMHEILGKAKRLGFTINPICEFSDRDVDAVLEADGTEESTLIVLELGGADDSDVC